MTLASCDDRLTTAVRAMRSLAYQPREVARRRRSHELDDIAHVGMDLIRTCRIRRPHGPALVDIAERLGRLDWKEIEASL